jgi:phage baseplate assembly protein W|tara:strand:- start:254 stop:712 length:459 start_codon:yes stop_codon:yes gene_type:complete
MPTYVGFSTINSEKPRTVNEIGGIDNTGDLIKNPLVFGKKYRLTDAELVIQDLVNALNIRRGEKVGQPAYGTTLWDFVFEPNTQDVVQQLKNELQRVIAQDPRLNVNRIEAYPREGGILVELELAVTPFNNAGDLNLFFDNQTNSAAIIAQT